MNSKTFCMSPFVRMTQWWNGNLNTCTHYHEMSGDGSYHEKQIFIAWRQTREWITYIFIYNFYIEELIGFTKELWHNQSNTVIGLGLAKLILLGIYIKLLDICQQWGSD